MTSMAIGVLVLSEWSAALLPPPGVHPAFRMRLSDGDEYRAIRRPGPATCDGQLDKDALWACVGHGIVTGAVGTRVRAVRPIIKDDDGVSEVSFRFGPPVGLVPAYGGAQRLRTAGVVIPHGLCKGQYLVGQHDAVLRVLVEVRERYSNVVVFPHSAGLKHSPRRFVALDGKSFATIGDEHDRPNVESCYIFEAIDADVLEPLTCEPHALGILVTMSREVSLEPLNDAAVVTFPVEQAMFRDSCPEVVSPCKAERLGPKRVLLRLRLPEEPTLYHIRLPSNLRTPEGKRVWSRELWLTHKPTEPQHRLREGDLTGEIKASSENDGSDTNAP